jgi:hypothetical protein
MSFALLACSPPTAPGADKAGAPEASAPADAAAAAVSSTEPPAGAEDAIKAWARAQHGTSLIEPVDIFYGDFTGDGAADALAFASFEMGGSGAGLSVALFRNEGGRMAFMRTDDTVFGSEPRNVRFATGRITLTTTMPKPGDPHCCPTGEQDWAINAR